MKLLDEDVDNDFYQKYSWDTASVANVGWDVYTGEGDAGSMLPGNGWGNGDGNWDGDGDCYHTCDLTDYKARKP